MGVKLTFDGTILSLSAILGNKYNDLEKEDLTSRIFMQYTMKLNI